MCPFLVYTSHTPEGVLSSNLVYPATFSGNLLAFKRNIIRHYFKNQTIKLHLSTESRTRCHCHHQEQGHVTSRAIPVLGLIFSSQSPYILVFRSPTSLVVAIPVAILSLFSIFRVFLFLLQLVQGCWTAIRIKFTPLICLRAIARMVNFYQSRASPAPISHL